MRKIQLPPADYHALATKHGLEWLGPEVSGTHDKTGWRCSEGHEWQSTYYLVNRGHVCRRCADKTRCAHRRLAPNQYHELAALRGFQWLGPEVQSYKHKTRWQCPKGHIWEASYGDIRYVGYGCGVCSGRADKTPDEYLAVALEKGIEWIGVLPLRVNDGTRWRCEAGHEWSAPLWVVRRANGSGCSRCSALRFGASRRIPKSRYTELAIKLGVEWLGSDNTKTHTPTLWRCGQGHIWSASYDNLRYGGDCPTCNNFINGKRASRPQRTVGNLTGGEINHRVGDKAVDVAIFRDGVKVAIEYDCWYWHKNSGEKDERRVQWLISQGWRVLSIRANEMLPDLDTLQWAIQQLVDGRDRIDLYLEDWGGDTLDLLS
jgi:hypothetical protein